MNNTRPSTGKMYAPILEELHDGFWEHDQLGIEYNFPPESLSHATKIFVTVLFAWPLPGKMCECYFLEKSGKRRRRRKHGGAPSSCWTERKATVDLNVPSEEEVAAGQDSDGGQDEKGRRKKEKGKKRHHKHKVILVKIFEGFLPLSNVCVVCVHGSTAD